MHDVYVSEGVRQRGLGRQLINALITELTTLGAPRILLSTMIQNERAQRVFASCGFRPTLLEMTRDI